MNTGCAATQEKTTGLFGLSASVPGCAYALLTTISGLAC